MCWKQFSQSQVHREVHVLLGEKRTKQPDMDHVYAKENETQLSQQCSGRGVLLPPQPL